MSSPSFTYVPSVNVSWCTDKEVFPTVNNSSFDLYVFVPSALTSAVNTPSCLYDPSGTSVVTTSTLNTIEFLAVNSGYLNVTTEIASLFLKKGKVIYSVEGKNSKSIVYDETKEKFK